MPGMEGILAGDVIRPHLLAAGKMVLNPKVSLDLAFEDGLWGFDGLPREILPFRHHADADHLVVLRNIPEPPFLGDEGHSGSALVNPGVAFGALVVSPHGDLVK